jgi:transposase InsO family protein
VALCLFATTNQQNMKQIYHSNSRTNVHNRTDINKSELSAVALSKQYNVSIPTITKWRNRASFEDKSSRPHHIKYRLSESEKQVCCVVRRLTWWPLDDLVEALYPDNPKEMRSAVYRALRAENISAIPQDEKEKALKFKEYEPGYIHMDVTYLPKFDKKKQYLFVAIDRATRVMLYCIYDAKTAENAYSFLQKCIAFFPVDLTYLLTDNGLEFTNKLIKSKKGTLCTKPSKVDELCAEHDIDHRLTKPGTPKTNGMVERVNGTIKNDTIKARDYENLSELQTHLLSFLVHYNVHRRHGGLRKELNVKTPMDAMQKWYKLKPELFKETPEEFMKKVLSLKIE